MTWSKLEQAILGGIRDDAAIGCVPRRKDLPPGTIAAVECQPGGPVSRIGFYLFPKPDDAQAVYRKRIRDEGLALSEQTSRGWEHCALGDTDTTACRDREAGFVNSDGYANYRAVQGRLYIGILGTSRDVQRLREWTWGNFDGGGSERTYSNVWCNHAEPTSKGACPP